MKMVHRILEGLHDEAFELVPLTAPGGLRSFVEKMREVVFARATEEARELFRAGQKPGVLSRQSGESMLSYVSRRRRWWKLLRALDTSIELSEPTRVELMLELSGSSRQEALVVKACAEDSESFDSVATIPVDRYAGLHLREGRALRGQNANPRPGFRYAGKGSKSKGKSKGVTRRAYAAVEEGNEDDEDSWYDESWEGYPLEAYLAASYDDDEDDPELLPDEEQEYEEFELDERKDIALNFIEELDDTADAGHAIQLQLAARAAFGKPRARASHALRAKERVR